MSWRPAPHSSSTAPALTIELRLEEPGRAYVRAESFEGERRLLLWLARSGVLDRLRDVLDALLDEERAE